MRCPQDAEQCETEQDKKQTVQGSGDFYGQWLMKQVFQRHGDAQQDQPGNGFGQGHVPE